MQKYIERMFTEQKDLEDKIKKAKAALENPPYGSDEKGLKMLAEQVKSMELYLNCLTERIKYEEGKNGN